MTSAADPSALLPPDPTFPPSAYERTARLMRAGVLGFFLLASIGLVVNLVTNPNESVQTLLSSGPSAELGILFFPIGQYFGFGADPLILVGIAILIAVTVGRVLLATIDLYRGREWILASVCALVLGLLGVGLFVVPQFVH